MRLRLTIKKKKGQKPERRPERNLDEFLEAHSLRLEGRIHGDTCVLSISRAETKQAPSDPFLTSTIGLGATPAQARTDLARRLSGKLIVVGSGSSQRREIPVPDLYQVSTAEPLAS